MHVSSRAHLAAPRTLSGCCSVTRLGSSHLTRCPLLHCEASRCCRIPSWFASSSRQARQALSPPGRRSELCPPGSRAPSSHSRPQLTAVCPHALPPLQVYAAGTVTVSLAWWGAAEQRRAAASWVQEPVAMRAVLACLLLMLVSVATPQAARGWAHPPCSYFQEPILLMPWVCFRAGGLVAPRELHKVGERSLHAPALHPSTV